ncbi:MAG: FAD-binding oxidoreductase [Cytophaga sp.]|nr:FAD-binding oxidoreductase [Cytophaga sp.]
MDLRSQYPFWLLKDGMISSFPSLEENMETEVVIMGAGITGALMAYHLGKAGHKVMVVDRRHPGMGSTSASTGLLQYEIDVPLRKLIGLVGEEAAVRSYALCVQAIDSLHTIIKKTGAKVDFEYKPSFQYASSRWHVTDLRKEYELRRRHRLSDIEWLEADDIKKKFGFKAPAGVLSAEGAQVNAYKLSHCLLEYCNRNFGLTVFDTTEIEKWSESKSGVELKTTERKVIRAKKLIVCAGYESGNYLNKKVEIRNSTYAIISKPLPGDQFWYKDSLIWETAVPYLYMRSTLDHRLLVGGRDDSFYNPDKRDRRLERKALELENDFKKKFPAIPFQTDFAWAGTFCGTKDGLPYIGTPSPFSNTYFALGFGGNGITFSLMASEIIRDLLESKRNSDASLFSFDRS